MISNINSSVINRFLPPSQLCQFPLFSLTEKSDCVLINTNLIYSDQSHEILDEIDSLLLELDNIRVELKTKKEIDHCTIIPYLKKYTKRISGTDDESFDMISILSSRGKNSINGTDDGSCFDIVSCCSNVSTNGDSYSILSSRGKNSINGTDDGSCFDIVSCCSNNSTNGDSYSIDSSQDDMIPPLELPEPQLQDNQSSYPFVTMLRSLIYLRPVTTATLPMHNCYKY